MHVSPQAAAFFRSLPKEKQRRIEDLLERTLADAMVGDNSASKVHLREGMQSAILAESTLARIWDSPEEDEAWRDL